MRLASPVIWMRRTVTRDCELNGAGAVREGDKLLLFYRSANRDEAVFADPDRFDITGRRTRTSASAAPGPHFCLGAHLARREITAICRELLHRVPTSAPRASRTGCGPAFVNGIKHLPVSSAADRVLSRAR